jgi:aminoglycoside 6'-N-acetyltransferase
MPYVQGQKQIKCYIIFHNEHPIGYIQSYSLKDYPWENQDLDTKVIQEAAGIDLFIGEERCVGKGLGSEIINRFLEKYIWPSYRYCLADPDIRNEISLRLFQKCGFTEHKQILSKDALQRKVSLQLVIKERFPS